MRRASTQQARWNECDIKLYFPLDFQAGFRYTDLVNKAVYHGDLVTDLQRIPAIQIAADLSDILPAGILQLRKLQSKRLLFGI